MTLVDPPKDQTPQGKVESEIKAGRLSAKLKGTELPFVVVILLVAIVVLSFFQVTYERAEFETTISALVGVVGTLCGAFAQRIAERR